MSTPGLPIGSDVPTQQRQIRFDHVPRLRELIPNGGWPGVTYAQVLIQNLKAAADREERPAHLSRITSSFYYLIDGPRGSAQMALVGCGQRIPGAAPEGGERLFFTDGEVEALTGHKVEYPIWLSAAPQRDPVQAPSRQETVFHAGARAAVESEAPRQKRKYHRTAPYKKKPGSVRTRNVHGRYKAVPEVSHDGTRSQQPQSQAGAGEGGEGHARAEGGHPAQWQQDRPEGDES